jgi:PAS domain S-box-containing protein
MSKQNLTTKEIESLQKKIESQAQAIKSFQQKNQFFEMLIKSLPGLFYLFDDQLKVYRWNKNVELATGYSADEINNRNLFELFAEEEQQNVRKSIQHAFTTGSGVLEATLLTRNGQRSNYFFTGVTATIDETSYLLGMGIDISELKKAEDSLRESEALYRIFAERMTEGVVLCQALDIIFVNNAMIEMLGYQKPEDMLKDQILSFISDRFTMYFMEMFESLENQPNGERFFQARWIKKEQSEIWVEGRAILIQWKGKPSVLITARDITSAKLREISMQEETEHLRRENVNLRSSMKDRYRLGAIIGKSTAMQNVYEQLLNASGTEANVIIYGESGTGKELVAAAIHNMSRRRDKKFVTVNSAAIPDNLLESEFFGHKKGAFTNANTDRAGYLDLADGGTLFLDEVGDLSINLQAKLLRAIEGGGYNPVGSNVTKKSNFRIIAATNKNLLEMSKNGDVREDFFFRVHIIPIKLPPLRERKDDIPLLVESFVKKYSEHKKTVIIPGQIMEELIQYDWPGNVRELQNVIQRYLTVHRLDFLREENTLSIIPKHETAQKSHETKPYSQLKEDIADLERKNIMEALKKTKGNKTKAAELMGFSRKTLSRKMKRLGLV